MDKFIEKLSSKLSKARERRKRYYYNPDFHEEKVAAGHEIRVIKEVLRIYRETNKAE